VIDQELRCLAVQVDIFRQELFVVGTPAAAAGVEQYDITRLDAIRERRDVGALDRRTGQLLTQIENRCRSDVRLKRNFVDRLTVIKKVKRASQCVPVWVLIVTISLFTPCTASM